MSDRVPNPPSNPLVERLSGGRRGNDLVEDVVALVGYVGAGDDNQVRLYPDPDYQKWLEIPEGHVVDSAPRDDGRTLVWVTREAMLQFVFTADVLETLDGKFEGPAKMSTWQLIPETRYVAADMLGLLAVEEYGQGGIS